MNHKPIIYFLFIAAVITSGSTCNKDEKVTYYMTQEFKDYVVYPVGSYWVYEDTANAVIDSVFLERQTIDIRSGGHVYSYDYEELEQHFYSSYYGFRGGGSEYRKGEPDAWFYADGMFIQSSVPVGYTIHDDYKYEAYYNSFEIMNNVYESVKVFSINSEAYYTWSKNVGLIKQEILNSNDTTIWLLKKYHINN